MVQLIYRPEYQLYHFGPQHPFSPVRQQAFLSLLEALGYKPDAIQADPASRDDVLTAHSEAYVAQVEAASTGNPLPKAGQYGLGTVDVPVFNGMDLATRYLVGGTLRAAEMILAGEASVVLQLGGGLHHAQRELASGFCVYNDLSIAIRRLTSRGFRVAYVDIDVHHGDGVQWLHYDDPKVLTISLHESGQYLFPGTGGVHELGEGGGKGFKLNVPLEPETSDASYLEVFERVVPHALSWFQPDVLVVPCGADAHFKDPLADLLLTTRAYETLFKRLVELARQYAKGRALFTLAGGYDLDATVRVWMILYLTLAGVPLPDEIPSEWLKEWEARLNTILTPTLHDPPLPLRVRHSESIAMQNRHVSIRLMETAVKYWY